jgi:hypothetical protein
MTMTRAVSVRSTQKISIEVVVLLVVSSKLGDIRYRRNLFVVRTTTKRTSHTLRSANNNKKKKNNETYKQHLAIGKQQQQQQQEEQCHHNHQFRQVVITDNSETRDSKILLLLLRRIVFVPCDEEGRVHRPTWTIHILYLVHAHCCKPIVVKQRNKGQEDSSLPILLEMDPVFQPWEGTLYCSHAPLGTFSFF